MEKILHEFFKKIIAGIKLLWNSYMLNTFKSHLKASFKVSKFTNQWKLHPLEHLNI